MITCQSTMTLLSTLRGGEGGGESDDDWERRMDEETDDGCNTSHVTSPSHMYVCLGIIYADTTTLATTPCMTTTVGISSDAKTALRNYFIDLIVATMAQPTTTTAATASSTALATTTITLATTTVTRISSEAKTALRNYFIEMLGLGT